MYYLLQSWNQAYIYIVLRIPIIMINRMIKINIIKMGINLWLYIWVANTLPIASWILFHNIHENVNVANIILISYIVEILNSIRPTFLHYEKIMSSKSSLPCNYVTYVQLYCNLCVPMQPMRNYVTSFSLKCNDFCFLNAMLKIHKILL
jgi:hypothetical protein